MKNPFVMVIFGATGDLAINKLIPSLFSLFKKQRLPKDFFIIGLSRRDLSNQQFREYFKNLKNEKDWQEFSNHLIYERGDLNEKETYLRLISTLNKYDEKLGICCFRLFYLALPPSNYEAILDNLSSSKLAAGYGQGSASWTKIVIEKPFGKDLDTSIALDKKLSKIFNEHQIFRVDHYLGKETMQNIIAFRFANGIFEPVWNRNFIDHVQITLAEEKGIENRGKFFDGVGILRDIGQNHIMQMIAAIAMEQPRSFTKEGLRDARASAIKAIRQIEEDQVSEFVVRGQYNDYETENDVVKNSKTETFAAMKLFVDTPRFKEIPFYVRVGKKMPKNTVEISIVFIQTCHILFKEYGCPEIGNVLRIRIQPNEGIGIRVIAKVPGSKLSLGTVNMDFSYDEEFGTKGADAYEKVLLDIFAGDQMLFNRSDELAASWGLITKILKGWEKLNDLKKYKEATWGPKEADELIQKDGKKWLKQ